MNGEELEFTGHYKPATLLTGAANETRTGPVDPVTVSSHEIAYCFDVQLPSLARDLGELGCDVLLNGMVHIYGYIKSGVVSWNSSPFVYSRRIRRITPPAPFSISFSLPGPIEPFFSNFEVTRDSIKGIVLRRGLPEASRRYFINNIM